MNFLGYNGEWELDKKIKLTTLDNSGWSLTIDLKDTELEDEVFQKIEINRSKEYWLSCEVRDKKFEARCCPTKLPVVMNIFRDWVANVYTATL